MIELILWAVGALWAFGVLVGLGGAIWAWCRLSNGYVAMVQEERDKCGP